MHCVLKSKILGNLVQILHGVTIFPNLAKLENVFARCCKSCNFALDCKQSCLPKILLSNTQCAVVFVRIVQTMFAFYDCLCVWLSGQSPSTHTRVYEPKTVVLLQLFHFIIGISYYHEWYSLITYHQALLISTERSEGYHLSNTCATIAKKTVHAVFFTL